MAGATLNLEFPPAYSLPSASEPVVSAATTEADSPVPLSFAEQQNALAAAAAAEAAQEQAAQERAQRVVMFGRGGKRTDFTAGFAAPTDPLASLFGSPLRPPMPAPAAPGAGASKAMGPRGVGPRAPSSSLLEVRGRAGAGAGASAGAREDDEEEGDGPQGSRQVEYGGDMKQAYNLYEQFVPIEPTPLSPSPFVAHPPPKQNLYPHEHTRAQLTITPDTGELTPNAGDGLQTTTMPYQYRPYIKQEKLHRGVDPLVYRTMYAWKPNSPAPGPGDVSVQGAVKTARDMFKPRDWSVKIAQPTANVEIARRGADNFGADHSSPVAVPTMPPEFYQFSAPTPPMFHAPLPPEPRKGHANAALRAPDIFPTFLEEQTTVTDAAAATAEAETDAALAVQSAADEVATAELEIEAEEQSADHTEGEADVAADADAEAEAAAEMEAGVAEGEAAAAAEEAVAAAADSESYDPRLPPGAFFRPFPMPKYPHSHPRVYTSLRDIRDNPFWAVNGGAADTNADADTDATADASAGVMSLRDAIAALKALQQKRQAQAQALPRAPAPLAVPQQSIPQQPQPQVSTPQQTTAAPIAATVTAPAAKAQAKAKAAASAAAMHEQYQRLAAQHRALLSERDRRDAEAGQRWHTLSAKADAQPLTRYEELQRAADRLPHQRYHELHRALLHHPYERYDALAAQYANAKADAHTNAYDQYSALHTELYGAPPPPPPVADAARFSQAHGAAEAQADAEAEVEGYSTAAPPASFVAPAAHDAEDAEDVDASAAAAEAEEADVEAEAIAHVEAAAAEVEAEADAVDAEPQQHMALLYPSVRAAARQQGVLQP